MRQIINFDLPASEQVIVDKIVQRAAKIAKRHDRSLDRLSCDMDITACHLNGNPLRLADLLAAKDFDFAHDVFGIERHIDRRTGKLTGFFSPRYSAKSGASHDD